jgi:hypothetical protein
LRNGVRRWDDHRADGEVLVKAFATTVNSGDTRVRALRVPRGLRVPMRLAVGRVDPVA